MMKVELVLLIFCSACFGVLMESFESEWERDKTATNKEVSSPEFNVLGASSGGAAKKLPEYLAVPISSDHKEDLKPENSARPVPRWLQKVLLGVPAAVPRAEGATRKSDLVEVLCYLDRINVRVKRKVFKSENAHTYLSLGSCPVSQIHEDHYSFLYYLKTDCGFKKESFPDYLSVSILLHYNPTVPVLREMPFDIPLQCKYHRLFYLYKVGFHPKPQEGTVYSKLLSNSNFTISPPDAAGVRSITSRNIYNLGDPMHFEVSGHDKTGEKRIYIKKCFVTASQDPYSHPQYTVIDNKGCMVDSKASTKSKFLASDSKMTQKFSVGAFLFKQDVSSTSPQEFSMHCEMSAGPPSPTPSSKACNYDEATQKWKELYGKDGVCDCCESTCQSADPEGGSDSEKVVSRHPWKLD